MKRALGHKSFEQTANQIARRYGHSKATKVILGYQSRILESVSFGYRKITTGEYVPNKYLRNFGWKNTYYQHAICIVEVNVMEH